jgi:two-component system OmpR family response regulator
MSTILIVEDDNDTCEALTKLLERHGYAASCARNGWEALLALDHHSIELVLLDLCMPGMDGETFLGILRNDVRRKTLPVIVLSASDTPDARAKTDRLGVQDFLVKANYSFPQLLATIRRYLPDPGVPQSRRSTASGPGSGPVN